MVLLSTAAPASKGKTEQSGPRRPSKDLVSDFRRIAAIAQTLSEDSRWESAPPAAAAGKIILKRDTFGLDEKTGKPKSSAESTKYLSISDSKEADIRVLLELNSKEREGLGLTRVARTRTVEGRAEQFHETHFEMPDAVYRYSLVTAKKS